MASLSGGIGLPPPPPAAQPAARAGPAAAIEPEAALPYEPVAPYASSSSLAAGSSTASELPPAKTSPRLHVSSEAPRAHLHATAAAAAAAHVPAPSRQLLLSPPRQAVAPLPAAPMPLAAPAPAPVPAPATAAGKSALARRVRELRREHATFAGEVRAMLAQNAKALGTLAAKVTSAAAEADAAAAALAAAKRGLERDVARLAADVRARDAEIAAGLLREEAAEAKTAAAAARVSVLTDQARLLRDALAEARGGIRVIVRVRPLLPMDLRPGSFIGAQLRWLAAFLWGGGSASSRVPEGAWGALARALGWCGEPGALKALLQGSSAGEATGAAATGLDDLDVGPSLICLGTTLDDAKQGVATGAPMPMREALRCFDAEAAAAAMSGSGSTSDELPAFLARAAARAERDGCQYFYDRVYGPGTSQLELFKELRPLLDAGLRGRPVTVLAYGATGSGKSHSMIGVLPPPGAGIGAPHAMRAAAAHEDEDALTFEATVGATLGREAGVIPSALAYLLSKTGPAGGLSLSVSCFEVYNDEVRDLMGAGVGGGAAVTKPRAGVKARPVAASSSAAAAAASDEGNLTELPVTSVAEGVEALRGCIARRAVGATAANDRSSRSHCIFRIALYRPDGRRHALLHLCDLAGSERVRESRVSGAALTEACHVNASLSALGEVMTALHKGATHVPFRNSKLTRILEPTLAAQGGSGGGAGVAPPTGPPRVLVLVTVSALPAHRELTAQALRFGAHVSAPVGAAAGWEPPQAAAAAAAAAAGSDRLPLASALPAQGSRPTPPWLRRGLAAALLPAAERRPGTGSRAATMSLPL